MHYFVCCGRGLKCIYKHFRIYYIKFRDILHCAENAEIEMDPEEASMKSKCFYKIRIDLALVGNRRDDGTLHNWHAPNNH